MSLPESQPAKTFLKRKNIESIILPLVILGVLFGILFIGILLPKKKETKKPEKNIVDILTQTNTIKNSKGETITVPPAVLQKSPQEVNDALESKEEIIIVQLLNQEGYNSAHIKGAIFIPENNNPATTYNLNFNNKHIFVSQDGVASAVLISKLVNLGLPRENNYNLEGGLKAWKEKGFPLEQ